jgi:PAS domain S-box-containing protein
LFQLDAQGARLPVDQREVYYPVLLAEPEAGNERAIGYDVGSEPIRRGALLEAARTGLVQASDPVALVQGSGDRHGVVLYRPVYGPGGRPQSLRGFAVAVLRLESVLRQSLRLSGNDQLGVSASLFQLAGDEPPRCVAWTTLDPRPPSDALPGLRPGPDTLADAVPFFRFGRSHVIQVRADPVYLAAHPLQQGRIVGGIGLLVTAILTGFVTVLVNHRAGLEREVRLRTSELRESENFQREIMAGLPAGVVVIDPQSRQIESVNRHAAALFGTPVEKILGNRCHAFLCPALEGACPVCDLRREVDNAEREMLRADGSRLAILKSVRRVQIGGRDKLLECFVDIRDRKQAEAALRQSEENYRTLFEQAGDGISILGTDGRYVDVNARYCAMLGRPREEIVGAPLEQHSVAATPAFLEHIHAHLEKQGTATFERELRRRDGTLLPVEVTVTLLRDKKTLAVVRDISERKRAEEQLRATMSEFERMNRVMMNREQRVLDLKKEVNQLRLACGQSLVYPSALERPEEPTPERKARP